MVGEPEGVSDIVGAGAGAWARAETATMARSAARRNPEEAMVGGCRRVEVAWKRRVQRSNKRNGRQREC